MVLRSDGYWSRSLLSCTKLGIGLGLGLGLSGLAMADSRNALDFESLMSEKALAQPVSTQAFAPPAVAAPVLTPFSGRLQMPAPLIASGKKIHSDLFDASNDASLMIAQLPVLDAELVQVDNDLVPLVRTHQRSHHPYWEWILEPGKVWTEPEDKGWFRAVLPFSLQERNANCIHNGLMTFLFKADGSVSNAAWQVTGETCQYLKMDLWGTSPASYEPGPIDSADAITSAYRREKAARLPLKPLQAIDTKYPGVQSEQFDWYPAGETTTSGFVMDGQHFSSGCPTRYGPHPFCETLSLPSYSTAKSLFAGMAYLMLAKDRPDVGETPLLDFVPECRDGTRWEGVTLEHLLDMATGHFRSPAFEVDEYASYKTAFMNGDTHEDKLSVACSLFPHREKPGEVFTYHTTDTYLAGLLMNRLPGVQDLFTDLIVKQLFEPLQLSGVSRETRRTYDSIAQPFTGFGLTFTADDVARLGLFLARDTGQLNGQTLLNPDLLQASLQRDERDTGIQAIDANYRYNNGFWAFRTNLRGACTRDVWIPYLSGYGGISIVLLPNNSIFYVFSDHGRFEWLSAAVASNAIKPFCPE